MSERVFNALFICTGNSARSIMAEAVLRQLGKGRFNAYSAGSQPRGEVHPLTLQVLSEHTHEVSQLRSKGWDEFTGPDAPIMDFVFTVCEQAAGQACPAWPGQPITAHWEFADPADVEGTDDDKLKAFQATHAAVTHRVRLLCSIPIDKLDRMSLRAELTRLGQGPKLSPET